MSKEFKEIITTERDLINSVNSKKVKAQKEFKGFIVNNDSISGIQIKDSLDTQTSEESSETKNETKNETETEVKVSGDSEKSSTKEENQNNSVNSALDIVKLINSAVEAATTPIQKELNTVKEQLDLTKSEKDKFINELQKTKEELEQSKKDVATLNDLSNLVGKSLKLEQPTKMTVEGEGGEYARKYEKLVNSAPTQKVVGDLVGIVQQKDLREANKYWKKNKQEISLGIEQILKNAGYLQGGGTVTNASTVVSDIPSVSFTHLSNFIRDNVYDDLIHYQFANTSVAPGTPPKLNTAVPRYPYFARPQSIASRQLTPGTPITSGSQPVNELNTLITIEELGLGKDSSSQPVGLTSFVTAFSINDLEKIVMNNLGMDYQGYIDLRLYSLWFTTDNIVYPGVNENIITSSANLTANDGRISKEFLVQLRSYMKIRKIKPYMLGLYGLVMNPTAFAQFANDLQVNERIMSAEATSKVSEILRSVPGTELGGVVSGLRLVWNGFMIFEQNSYGVGNVGDAGVTQISVESVNRLYDSNFAFGADTIARAIALSVEMREDDNMDFGRAKRFNWYSHEGFAPLDVKNNTLTGETLRVIQVRNLRTT